MQLIFAYNADSDVLSQAKDFVKKAVSPDTYACNLCKITYGIAEMKQEWRDFIDESDIDMEFLHRDELFNVYPHLKNEDLPAVFQKVDGEVEKVISAEEINDINTIDELKGLVMKKITA